MGLRVCQQQPMLDLEASSPENPLNPEPQSLKARPELELQEVVPLSADGSKFHASQSFKRVGMSRHATTRTKKLLWGVGSFGIFFGFRGVRV